MVMLKGCRGFVKGLTWFCYRIDVTWLCCMVDVVLLKG